MLHFFYYLTTALLPTEALTNTSHELEMGDHFCDFAHR